MSDKEKAIAIKDSKTGELATDSGYYCQFQRDAKLLLNSAFLPDRFSDPKKPIERRIADVCVGMAIARHFPAFEPVTVFQNIYFVGGQPAWKSAFITTLLKSQGLKVTFEEAGDWLTDKENAKTRAIATDARGLQYKSTWITWHLVKMEGWDQKNGSKWLSMPDQMARYRAAAFLARAYWPELLLGYYTTDERADFTDGEPPPECYQPLPVTQEPAPVPKSVIEAEAFDYASGPSAEQWAKAQEVLK